MIGRIAAIVAVVVVGIAIVGNPFYTVDETQQVIITQFGKPIGEPVKEPGLHVKLPFVQRANYFAKNLLEWDGDAGQIPTKDKTFISVDCFARWRIIDPLRFYESVNNERGAQKKLDDIMDSATYNFITSHHLIEVVRSTNRSLKMEKIDSAGLAPKLKEKDKIELGRVKMTEGILKQASPKVRQFGIEIVDFRMKRVNYVEDVRTKVYERMIAERKQMAEKFRSEGKGESKRIEGERQKDLKKIRSEAYRTAQEVKGKADAEATKIYAEAFGKDPEFYSFVNTLDIYKRSLDKDTRVLLSTESDFFKYLKNYSK